MKLILQTHIHYPTRKVLIKLRLIVYALSLSIRIAFSYPTNQGSPRIHHYIAALCSHLSCRPHFNITHRARVHTICQLTQYAVKLLVVPFSPMHHMRYACPLSLTTTGRLEAVKQQRKLVSHARDTRPFDGWAPCLWVICRIVLALQIHRVNMIIVMSRWSSNHKNTHTYRKVAVKECFQQEISIQRKGKHNIHRENTLEPMYCVQRADGAAGHSSCSTHTHTHTHKWSIQAASTENAPECEFDQFGCETKH